MRRYALILFTLCFPLLTACNPFPKTWEWNQKLTVEVETPQGVKSGSAVTHVSWQDANALGNYVARYSGEATVVEIAPGRYLFALIGEPTKYIAQYTFHKQFGTSRADYQTLLPEIEKFRGTADVPRDRYPLLVTFSDIADPTTVRKVDPDNLAASFGPGVNLVRITLEITDDKVTTNNAGRILTWLGPYPEPGLCAAAGATKNISFCRRVHHGNFDRR